MVQPGWPSGARSFTDCVYSSDRLDFSRSFSSLLISALKHLNSRKVGFVRAVN